MARIFRVEEAREQHEVGPAAISCGWGLPCVRDPGERRVGADMRFAVLAGEASEGVQVPRRLDQLVTEGPAQRDVAIDVLGQHGSLPPQGCAISDRSAISTLA